ncbi:endonuclease MutS2 [Clostridium manihotivorum]|uniref:DNA mismatch repair protein n=1 Tax=Clostridium manihotivorum TaxID=2320868 RepID=A0A410DYZ7_9CLOT|nr:endonuclease MutS2 [Clostridium manihotivorum]QAA34303.1 DNA mismatch repair protein [Clostridium manihotivorum]
MNSKAVEILEFNKIKEVLKEFALSDLGKKKIEELEPYMDINIVRRHMRETTETRAIVNRSSSVPLHSLKGVDSIKEKLSKGMILSAEELESLGSLLKDIKRLKNFMKTKEQIAPTVSSYALSLFEMEEVQMEIEKSISRGMVDDRASSKLQKIRKRIFILEERIKAKLDNILRNDKYKNYIQDSLVSQRNGRYVIPIKSEHKRTFDGNIHDRSQSGSTVFIEPAEVKKYQDELEQERFEEEKEVYRILSELTAIVASYEKELSLNIEGMSYYDFLFAKAKYSKSIDGNEAVFNNNNVIKINDGRHPLLGSKAVPLDFSIGEAYRGLVITGPNTGGKTVALKTVGLLSMMAQAGLHVSAGKDSEFAILGDILADIGDGQSIEQSLSTFSSHIKNIIGILDMADKYTLVILDEIGSGTDPGEGMGIAVAVLERLYEKGAIICATTHYNEIKDFAKEHEGFINGSMEFDINTLKPKYRLNIGKPGESNAFLIALRLGMDRRIIERAHTVTYKENKDYSSITFEQKAVEKSYSDNEKSKHSEQVIKIKESNKINRNIEKQKQKPLFDIGDSVFISFMNRTGIICEEENSKGEYGVMVMKKKIKISKKRLSKYISKDELYPEDYDFDIVFKSKKYRKVNRLLNKGNTDGVVLEEE